MLYPLPCQVIGPFGIPVLTFHQPGHITIPQQKGQFLFQVQAIEGFIFKSGNRIQTPIIGHYFFTSRYFIDQFTHPVEIGERLFAINTNGNGSSNDLDNQQTIHHPIMPAHRPYFIAIQPPGR
ncbi:hypothetical protein [Paraflavitalea speifideaquila]|uniref:hypothetical protein n=1 Tax=Paraflavitalea speifideaquila TaxID=3076558 RepID=UPI0028E348DC|nr:hypothetical protein [Paraflavitalea speifideiaquila]